MKEAGFVGEFSALKSNILTLKHPLYFFSIFLYLITPNSAFGLVWLTVFTPPFQQNSQQNSPKGHGGIGLIEHRGSRCGIDK